MLKKTLFPLLILLFALMFSSTAMAAGWGWYDVSIVKVGESGKGFEAVLTDNKGTPDFTNRQYRFYSSVTTEGQKLIIATLLTALASGKTASVYLHSHSTFSIVAAQVKN